VLVAIDVVVTVVVVVAMVLVVAAMTHVPSSAGLVTVNSRRGETLDNEWSLFVTFPSPGPNRTLYESPPVS
jgi:hypothetical protein